MNGELSLAIISEAVSRADAGRYRLCQKPGLSVRVLEKINQQAHAQVQMFALCQHGVNAVYQQTACCPRSDSTSAAL